MMLELVIAFAVGILTLGILTKSLAWPFKFFRTFITNSIAGAIMLWVVTLFGVPIKINIVSALIAGVFGIPGIVLVIAYTYL